MNYILDLYLVVVL